MLSTMNRLNIHEHYRRYDEVLQHPLDRLELLRNSETRRKKTFDSWPKDALIGCDDLIEDGFYYLGINMLYCGGVLSKRESGDSVHDEHKRHFKQCPKVWDDIMSDDENDLETNGRGYFDESDKQDYAQQDSHVHQPHNFRCQNEQKDQGDKISVKKYSERIINLENWPSDHHLKPDELASAGLYYKGSGDKCQCFLCGGIREEWEEGDIAKEEHKKWFPKCYNSMDNESNENDNKGNGDIKHGKIYIQGQDLEDETINKEFKLGAGSYKSNVLKKDVSKYTCGFLNGSQRGTLYIGVDDYGKVIGTQCDHATEDRIRIDIDRAIKTIKPNVFPQNYHVDFIPVIHKSSAPKDYKVIKITVEKVDNLTQLYETDRKVYIHRDGFIRGPLKLLEILKWTRHTKQEAGDIYDDAEIGKAADKDLEQADRMKSTGENLIMDDNYAVDSMRYKRLVRHRREIFQNSKDLHDRIDEANKWCTKGVDILANRQPEQCQTHLQVESARKEIASFLASAKELKLKNPKEFRPLLNGIMTADTGVAVEKVLKRIEDVTVMCLKRWEALVVRQVHPAPKHAPPEPDPLQNSLRPNNIYENSARQSSIGELEKQKLINRIGSLTAQVLAAEEAVKYRDEEVKEYKESVKYREDEVRNLKSENHRLTDELNSTIPELKAQTVMSKQTLNVNQRMFEPIQSTPILTDDFIPTEIKLLSDKKYVPVYLKLLKSGSEKKRDIRLVIVGKKGTGKTSLLKRLFREEINIGEVTSTNGIEIHRIRCKANSDDGIWKKLDGKKEETELHARLLKPFGKSLISQVKDPVKVSVDEAAHKFSQDNSQATSFVEGQVVDESQVTTSVTTTSHDLHLSSEQAFRDIKIMLKSDVDLQDKEDYATLFLWDFAGDEEFYHTHQTFLSPNAIYLVVTKLNEADDKDAQDLFRLWMNSIHCYSRLEEDKNKSDDIRRESDDLDPPVVIVGTWKDAVYSESGEFEDVCRGNILMYTENMAEDERGHIKNAFFISNTEDDNSVFNKIRQDILKLARSMRTWNKDYPLKFIQMENILQKKKKDLPIITLHELKQISTSTPEPLKPEELMLYLKYHHEIKSLVYFEDLPDYIILDTQWLSDAFKCIVTAKKFRNVSIKNQKRWEEFHCKGKLHREVIEEMFKKEQNILYKHKDHILKVMEKFDIIIRPTISNIDVPGEKQCYYVPCMIKAEPEYDIYQLFGVPENACQKSNWLCFKFKFLPPYLMNHLIASLCREYDVAEVATKEQKRQIALFRGSAVFELQKTPKLRKLLVMKGLNIIQIQVLQFGKQIERGLYNYIANFVTEEIVQIIDTRFKMSNVKFEKKWECSLTKPKSVTGFEEFSEEQTEIYYCGICRTTHSYTDEWSDPQRQNLSLPQMPFEDVPETDPKTETTRKSQTFSTKVHLNLQSGMEAFSSVSEGPNRTGSSTGFTKEEFNFAKMGMIVLNVLANALYDLLKQDKPNICARSDCDITYLYSEHRKLNKHVPSNSNHRRCPPGPWGGSWQDKQVTDIAIGDDIERIRLTRNELQHSRTFRLDDKRFNDLCNIVTDLLKRFDQYSKPARLYIDHLSEILAKTISEEEVKIVHQRIENEIKSALAIEVEIEHQVHV